MSICSAEVPAGARDSTGAAMEGRMTEFRKELKRVTCLILASVIIWYEDDESIRVGVREI